MTTIRFNPAWELNNLAQGIDKFVKYCASPETRPRVNFGKFSPRVDIHEDAQKYYFEVELAGVKKEEVKVTVNDENILTIQGDKKFEKENEINSCCRTERLFGNFTRSFQLVNEIEKEKIDAKYVDGVLFLEIPKKEPEKPKEQEINIS